MTSARYLVRDSTSGRVGPSESVISVPQKALTPSHPRLIVTSGAITSLAHPAIIPGQKDGARLREQMLHP